MTPSLARTLEILATLALLACSDAATPPMIVDSDAGVAHVEASTADPCATPAPGCPCEDVGAKASCGLVYRYSGSHVDCSPGYYTCQEDGGWSGCVGDSIYDGN